MSVLLTSILATLCSALVVWGLLSPGRIYQFPFLAGAVFLGWVLPQLVGMIGDPFLPPGALEKTLFMTILCAGMCYLGFMWQTRRSFVLDLQFDDRKLLWAGAGLTLFGSYFYFALSRLPEEQISMTEYTGTPVAYLFFADVLAYGLAISLVVYFKTLSRAALVLALFGSSFYLDRIIFAGRRGDVVKLVLMVLVGVWFVRRKAIPRSIMLPAMLIGSFVFNSIDQYRAIVLSDEGADWTRVFQIDFVGNIQQLTQHGGLEMTNAAYNIAATDEAMSFDFGLFNWNTLVFNYVPAQLVGHDFKEFLMIDIGDSAFSHFGYTSNVGTTETGMSDAFGSFWYFGSLKFFLIGYLLSITYRSAMAGNVTAQICYMLIIPYGLHSITHHTQWFFSPWVHMAIFLLPVLLLARKQVQLPAPWAVHEIRRA